MINCSTISFFFLLFHHHRHEKITFLDHKSMLLPLRFTNNSFFHFKIFFSFRNKSSLIYITLFIIFLMQIFSRWLVTKVFIQSLEKHTIASIHTKPSAIENFPSMFIPKLASPSSADPKSSPSLKTSYAPSLKRHPTVTLSSTAVPRCDTRHAFTFPNNRVASIIRP